MFVVAEELGLWTSCLASGTFFVLPWNYIRHGAEPDDLECSEKVEERSGEMIML